MQHTVWIIKFETCRSNLGVVYLSLLFAMRQILVKNWGKNISTHRLSNQYFVAWKLAVSTPLYLNLLSLSVCLNWRCIKIAKDHFESSGSFQKKKSLFLVEIVKITLKKIILSGREKLAFAKKIYDFGWRHLMSRSLKFSRERF